MMLLWQTVRQEPGKVQEMVNRCVFGGERLLGLHYGSWWNRRSDEVINVVQDDACWPGLGYKADDRFGQPVYLRRHAGIWEVAFPQRYGLTFVPGLIGSMLAILIIAVVSAGLGGIPMGLLCWYLLAGGLTWLVSGACAWTSGGVTLHRPSPLRPFALTLIFGGMLGIFAGMFVWRVTLV